MKTKKGFLLRTVGDEHIITGEGLEQINFNRLIALNSSAAYLWQEIKDNVFYTKTLADLLTAKYDIPYEEAVTDAENITNSWFKAGIIEE